jgi:hypothetical protein
LQETKDDNGESTGEAYHDRILHIRADWNSSRLEDNSNMNVDVFWRDTKLEHQQVSELLL